MPNPNSNPNPHAYDAAHAFSARRTKPSKPCLRRTVPSHRNRNKSAFETTAPPHSTPTTNPHTHPTLVAPRISRSTGKERDTESGLDYFGARYYGSNMGRFMSPDPLLSSGRPENPQTWNRYTYGLNNPLSIIDPTGLYNLVNNCAGDDSKCNKAFAQDAKNLKDGLAALTKAVNGLQDGAQKTALQGALGAIGTENDGNNFGRSIRSTVRQYRWKHGSLS